VAVADVERAEQLIAELNAQLLQSRQQEALLIDALTRVLSIIEQDQNR
jgi:outer membrane protein TolC